MAILVKGMEMPTCCRKCELFGEYGCAIVGAVGSAYTDGRRSRDCPLVLCEDDRVPCVDESLNKIMEEVCEICRYKGDYKDPDDLIRERCNCCKVVATVDEVLYGK